jgi:dihydrofolate reductase
MIKLIACIGPNGELGLNNDLVYHNKQDMKFFKDSTTNNVVIMGKNTFESLGAKPLPNRINIVLSEEDMFYPGVLVWDIPLANALMNATALFPMLDIYIIGGAYVYNQAIEQQLADEILLTHMYKEKDADTFIDKIMLKNKYNIVQIIDPVKEKNEEVGVIVKLERREA